MYPPESMRVRRPTERRPERRGVSDKDGDERAHGQTWTMPANSDPSCERAYQVTKRGWSGTCVKKKGGGKVPGNAHPEGKVEGETQAGKVDDRKRQPFSGRQVFDVVYWADEYREAGVLVICHVSRFMRMRVRGGEGRGKTCPTMTRRLAMLR